MVIKLIEHHHVSVYTHAHTERAVNVVLCDFFCRDKAECLNLQLFVVTSVVPSP